MENDVLADCSSVATGERARDLLPRLLSEHARAALEYEKFRTVKASCFSDARDAAGEKPVTDTVWERAIIAKYGFEVLEHGKATFHRLEALAAQIQGYSAILCFDAATPA